MFYFLSPIFSVRHPWVTLGLWHDPWCELTPTCCQYDDPDTTEWPLRTARAGEPRSHARRDSGTGCALCARASLHTYGSSQHYKDTIREDIYYAGRRKYVYMLVLAWELLDWFWGHERLQEANRWQLKQKINECRRKHGGINDKLIILAETGGNLCLVNHRLLSCFQINNFKQLSHWKLK